MIQQRHGLISSYFFVAVSCTNEAGLTLLTLLAKPRLGKRFFTPVFFRFSIDLSAKSEFSLCSGFARAFSLASGTFGQLPLILVSCRH
jgi:hypothetical protein